MNTFHKLLLLVLPTIFSLAKSVPVAVPWTYLPTGVNSADPTARVFEGRLFVYTSWDHVRLCRPKWSSPLKKQGQQKFCMPGYRAVSTSDSSLNPKSWVNHKAILEEESIPWVFKPEGFSGSARMWAPDVVQGDDGVYYLFFPGPRTQHNIAIGVATSKTPEGPFTPRPTPIEGTDGIDPSVVKLPNGQWVLFTSKSMEGISVQNLDKNFMSASSKKVVVPAKGTYVEAPFAEIRSGNLMLQYAQAKSGYRIRQSVGHNPNNPVQGFKQLGLAIDNVDYYGRTNHGSVVTYKGRSWAFYHRHTEKENAPWRARRAVYSPIQFSSDGRQNTIYPPVYNTG